MKFIFNNCIILCDTELIRKSSVLSFVDDKNMVTNEDKIHDVCFANNRNITISSYAFIRHFFHSKTTKKKRLIINSLSYHCLLGVLDTLQYLDMDEILLETIMMINKDCRKKKCYVFKLLKHFGHYI
jgi:hypothetical protein